MNDDPIEEAASRLARARALVIAAGAGMGVDSGLPDFRGDAGFWSAYPAYAHLGLSFVDLANPRWFSRDPELAWGFYGHRLSLYRRTVPHSGFSRLREIAARLPYGAFVLTSNVDGQFQRGGFDERRVVECHGSIHHVQCTRECGRPLASADGIEVDVDPTTFRARAPLPRCACGALLRPAILMFGDGSWDDSRTSAQEQRLDAWLDGLDVASGELVIVECGAGTHVPTVRAFSERLARAKNASLVRINAREPDVPHGPHVGLAMKARDAIEAIAERLSLGEGSRRSRDGQ